VAAVVRTDEIDDVDLARIGELARLPVEENGPGFDPVPQRVTDIHVFVGLIVPLVVLDLIQAKCAMFATQMA